MNITITSILGLIYLGVVNGIMIRWKNSTGEEIEIWNKWLHRFMLVIRSLFVLIVWFNTFNYLYTGIILIITSLEYNISINLINKLKWYYLGTTAKTDMLLRKIYLKLKIRWIWFTHQFK